jgi:BirA family biotin operon repressor/biotin-[acetyl-CoA-carboxylase] ligase
LLPLLAGISVADAVQQISGLQPTLKWPNDVLCGALKLAGILAEASADWVVLGIGVNVNTPGDELPESGTSIMALTGRPTSREALLAAILDELDRNITKSSRSGDSWIVGQWRARAAILGEPIEVSLAGKQQTGVAEDIDETGRLWIRLATGERIPLVAGQVRWLRPVPGQS